MMFSMLEGMPVLRCFGALVFLYPTSLSLLNLELICRSYGSSGFLWSILCFRGSGMRMAPAVVPLQPLPKEPQLLQTDSEFDETKFVGKLATRANTILKEIPIIRK